MAIHGRYFRQKPAELKGTDYDSRLEKRLHEALPILNHHPAKRPYVRHHTYEPDFEVQGNKTYLVEAKGYFQDRNELGKYLPIAESLGDSAELVFVFENADKPIHFQAKRKDGSKMTHREWCVKNGFQVFDEDEFRVWIPSVTTVTESGDTELS